MSAIRRETRATRRALRAGMAPELIARQMEL